MNLPSRNEKRDIVPNFVRVRGILCLQPTLKKVGIGTPQVPTPHEMHMLRFMI